jgi:hypothetical protein
MDLCQRIVELWKDDPEMGRNRIAEAFNISQDRARYLISKARKLQNKQKLASHQRLREEGKKNREERELAESHERTKDTWTVSLPRTRICTLEQLIEQCNVNTDEWEIDTWEANKWEIGAKNDLTGKIEVEPLYQVKARFKRKKTAALHGLIAELAEKAKQHAPQYKPFKYRPASGNMLEIDIFDAHFGKLAWSKETGGADYDLRIACDRFHEAVETILARTLHFGIDKIIFPVGNDLLQFDSQAGTTTSGTHVDTDSRYKKVFRVAHEMLITTSDRLSAIAPLEIIIVPGNHDELSAWTIGFALECWYRNNQNVVVNNAEPLRKFHEWGKTMQMFTHGDKGNRNDYRLLMATEQREMWGRAKFCEIHTGHLHQDKVNEKFGVKQRILRALCPPDQWHANSAYTGNQEGCDGYVWNKEEGIISVASYTVVDKPLTEFRKEKKRPKPKGYVI